MCYACSSCDHSDIVASACLEGDAAESKIIWKGRSRSVVRNASHHAGGERGASANRGAHRASTMSCAAPGAMVPVSRAPIASVPVAVAIVLVPPADHCCKNLLKCVLSWVGLRVWFAVLL